MAFNIILKMFRSNFIIQTIFAIYCIFGEMSGELENYLFAFCSLAWWLKVFKWFGVVTALPHSMSSIFERFRALSSSRKYIFHDILMVWHAVIWALWRSRNDRIFPSIVVAPQEIFDRIRIISWKWLLAKKISSSYLFYEWFIDSFDCIARYAFGGCWDGRSPICTFLIWVGRVSLVLFPFSSLY
jgi:hypothetical protein